MNDKRAQFDKRAADPNAEIIRYLLAWKGASHFPIPADASWRNDMADLLVRADLVALTGMVIGREIEREENQRLMFLAHAVLDYDTWVRFVRALQVLPMRQVELDAIWGEVKDVWQEAHDLRRAAQNLFADAAEERMALASDYESKSKKIGELERSVVMLQDDNDYLRRVLASRGEEVEALRAKLADFDALREIISRISM